MSILTFLTVLKQSGKLKRQPADFPHASPWRGNSSAFPLPTLTSKVRCLPFSEALQPPATKGKYPLGTPKDWGLILNP